MSPTKVLLIIMAIAGLGPRAAQSQARLIEFKVYERVLDDMIDAVGNVSGSNGPYSVGFYRPCFPDVWNSCWTTIASGKVYWTLKNNNINVTTSAITLNGDVSLSWSYFGLITTYSSYAGLSYNSSTRSLRLTTNTISIPVRFLGVTITTLHPTVPFAMTLPMSGFSLPGVRGDGSARSINAGAMGVLVGRQSGYIRLRLDPGFGT